MCRDCFHCHYGICLDKITNKVPCKLKQGEEVLNEEAKDCEEFIPSIALDNDAVEVITEFNIHHKCPYCGHEDILYNTDGEDEEIIECEECGKKYSINWCIY